MEFETLVSLALGFFVPVVVSFLKNVTWPRYQRIILAGAVSFTSACAALAVQGELNSLQDVVNNTALVWASATAFYKMHFGDTDLNIKLEGIGVGKN